MSAPKTPRSTRAPSRSSSPQKASYVGSLTSRGAAASHVGRRPFRASPYSVNWLTTSTGAPTSDADFSSRKIRSPHNFRAIHATSSGPSECVIPRYTSSPASSTAPTTSPSTITRAEATRCTTARMRSPCQTSDAGRVADVRNECPHNQSQAPDRRSATAPTATMTRSKPARPDMPQPPARRLG